MERYLTLEETAEELRISKDAVKKLLKRQRLVGIEITTGHWRILDPSPRLRQYLIDQPVERFPFLTRNELAEVLGIKPCSVKWHVQEGHVTPVKIEGATHRVFSVSQVRQLIAHREGLLGRWKHNYSTFLVKWLKSFLADDLESNAEAISAMLDSAVRLPEPEKSQKVVEIWALVDRLNALLKECRG